MTTMTTRRMRTHVQQQNTARWAPDNNVGEAVRWIFGTEDEDEQENRYRHCMDYLRGSSARGELKRWVMGITYLASPDRIQELVNRYYRKVKEEHKGLEQARYERKKKRKGPGFEFL